MNCRTERKSLDTIIARLKTPSGGAITYVCP
jgi:hypothetical protein